MDLESMRTFFLWCTLINFGLLAWWFGFFLLGRAWIKRIHGRWFQMTDEQFDALHYGGMGLLKIAWFFFNLVPYAALSLMA